MRASEFFKKVISLNLLPSEFYILGGGALLLYGVREETKDIDLCVSNKLFNILKSEGRIDLSSKNECGFYKLIDNPEVEIVPCNKKDFKCIKLGDLYVEDINEILKYKKKRNLPKDKEDISKIKLFLKFKSNLNRGEI